MVPTEEVQVLVDERRESPGMGVRNCVSIDLQLTQYRIHVARVPEHDRIDDEAQRAELIFLPLFVARPTALQRTGCRRLSAFRSGSRPASVSRERDRIR